MSYSREDWRYVAGVLSPRTFNGWAAGDSDPDELPTEKELSRELKKNIGCHDCECEDEYNDVVSYVQDLKFDQHNAYREKLEEFGGNTVDQIGTIHRAISNFLNGDNLDKDRCLEFIESVQSQLEDIVPVRVSVNSLINMGVINKDCSMVKILNNSARRVMVDYHAGKNSWRGEFDDIVVNVFANRFSLFYGNNIIFFHKDNIIVGTQRSISYFWLEQYFSDWAKPTDQEIEMAKMIEPEYSRSLDILKTLSQKLLG